MKLLSCHTRGKCAHAVRTPPALRRRAEQESAERRCRLYAETSVRPADNLGSAYCVALRKTNKAAHTRHGTHASEEKDVENKDVFDGDGD